MVEGIREHGVEDGAAGGKDEAMRADLRRRAVVRSDHEDDVGASLPLSNIATWRSMTVVSKRGRGFIVIGHVSQRTVFNKSKKNVF